MYNYLTMRHEVTELYVCEDCGIDCDDTNEYGQCASCEHIQTLEQAESMAEFIEECRREVA